MLAAASADGGRPRLTDRPVTPVERALAAREVASEDLPDHWVCREHALDLVEQMVRLSVEAAERDLRRRLQEDWRCPN